MSKNDNIKFLYENGNAACIISYKNYKMIGEATCHPDDTDFESQRTGLCIAEARANIKLLRFKRDCEILPALKILVHIQNNMDTSTKYNSKSYEAKMIHRQIKSLKNQLNIINTDIKEEQKYLREYIQKKDELYKKLRAKNQ